MDAKHAAWPPSDGDKDWVRWLDQEALISILLPADWLVQEDPGFSLLLVGPEDHGIRPNLTVRKIAVPATDRIIIEASERQILAQLQDAYSDFKLLEQKSVKLDKIFDGTIYKVSWTNSRGIKVVQSMLLVSGGPSLFHLMGSVPANSAGKWLPTMERIFLSLSFRLRRVAEARTAS